MSKTILLMAGGTGGHIFPALAVGTTLKEQGWNLHWLGAEGGMEQALVAKHKIKLSLLPVKGLRGKGLLALLKAPFKIIASILGARKIIKEINPDVVLGMGGYASAPGGVAAKLCGVPLVIHEQNAVSGLTNKLLHKLSYFTLQAYPSAFLGNKKIHTTGNPVRTDFYNIVTAEKRLERVDGKINLLIVGGSLGAEVFNKRLPETMNIINSGLLINIRHQSGRGKSEQVKADYLKCTNSKVRYQVSEFIDDMAEAYSWADLVICRAGALTVAEIAMAGCAAIFVPFPHAVDDHQTYNARYLADRGAGLIIPQHDLTKKRLAQQITALANNKEHLIEMALTARKLAKPNATKQVAEYCIKASAHDLGTNGKSSKGVQV